MAETATLAQADRLAAHLRRLDYMFPRAYALVGPGPDFAITRISPMVAKPTPNKDIQKLARPALAESMSTSTTWDAHLVMKSMFGLR